MVEFGVPIFFGIFAALGWWAIRGNEYLWIDWGQDPGPDLMPVIVLSLLSAGSLIMLVRAVVLWLRRGGTLLSPVLRNLPVPLLFAASLLALVPLMRWIGFLAAALLFAIPWTVALSDGSRPVSRRRRIAEAVLSAAAGVALVTYLFVHVIRVPLP